MADRARLGYVILFVADLAASVAFYRDVVGFEFRFEDAGYAEFATGETRFALYERRRADWLVGRPLAGGPDLPAADPRPALPLPTLPRPALLLPAEVVVPVPAVAATHARLRAAGVPVLAEPTDRPWGHRTLHVADPDGVVVEFAQEIPRRRGRRF